MPSKVARPRTEGHVGRNAAKLGRVSSEEGRQAMRDHKRTFAAFFPRQQAVTLKLIMPLTLSAVSAQAQDVFGLFRLFSPQAVRTPVYQ
jgi:hypothetical protein